MNTNKVINSKGQEIFTDVTLHPGELLADEIDVRGIKKSEFARLLRMNPANLSELLHGKRHISALRALQLEKLLGISASYWLRIQNEYDLFIAKNSKQKELAELHLI